MYTSYTNPLLAPCVTSLFGQYPDEGTQFCSLIATLRYIAIKHCGDDLSQLKNKLKFFVTPYSRGWSKNTFIDNITTGGNKNDSFIIYTPMSSVESLPDLTIEGWKRLNTAPYPVEEYLSKYTQTIVLTNESKKRVVVILRKEVPEVINAIQSVMFRILSWYYPTRCDIPEDEAQLFRAIAENNEKKFLSLCQALVDKYDLEVSYMKDKLHGWNNRGVDIVIDEVRKSMEDQLLRMQEIESKKQKIIQSYNKEKITYEALIKSRGEDDEEAWKFFSERRNYIRSLEVDEENCTFDIVQLLEFYDREVFLLLLENPRSSLYRKGRKLAKALKGIFIDDIGKIQVRSRFALNGFVSLKPCHTYSFYSNNCVRHPHLGRSLCLGANGKYVDEYLLNGQWQQAVDQVVAATKNINFTDASVISNFVDDLIICMDEKFVVSRDSSLISMNDVLSIMDKEEETKNGKKTQTTTE